MFFRLLIYILIGGFFCPRIASEQITIGLLRSVHLLRFGNEAGTCFTLTIDAKQYVITAKHVVDEIKSGDKVSIYRGGAWEEIAVSPISIGSKLDIAILVPERPVSDPSFDIGAGSLGGLNMASEVYFLGFPYGGNLSVGDRTYRLFSTLSLSGSTYPAALVKRGIISGFDDSDMESPVFYIDGMNNPGFSGGPVVFYDKTSNQPKVIGVVSARIPEELMTSKGVEAPPVWVNSGIIIAHQISSALDAIREYTKQK